MDVSEEVNPVKTDGFLDYLLKTNMSPGLHIPCFGGVLSVQQNELVPSVMRKLSAEGFTSAPVLNGDVFLGFIDMLDLVKFVTSLYWGDEVLAWVDFWNKEVKFQQSTVANVLAFVRKTPHRAPLLPDVLCATNSTMHALELMASRGHHRLPILEGTGKLVGLFTQSMLISELAQRLYSLSPALRYKRVKELLPMLKAEVHYCSEDTRAINAFSVMAQQGITGLPVLDEFGLLAGAISTTDLKGIGFDGKHFSRLFDTIKQYKRVCTDEFPLAAPRSHFSKKPVPRRALYVTDEQTFEDVIRTMDDGNIHRVFVVSAGSALKGAPRVDCVITQTDVLSILWKHYTYVV